MLYRVAIIQNPNNKFLVQKIAYSKIQNDRKTIGYFLRDYLGPPFNTMEEACKHATEILDLLVQIEQLDHKIDYSIRKEDVNEVKILRERATALREFLNQLTRTL